MTCVNEWPCGVSPIDGPLDLPRTAVFRLVEGNQTCKLWTRDLVLIILVNLCVFTNHIMSLSTFPFYIQSLGGTEALAGKRGRNLCAGAGAVLLHPHSQAAG